MMENNSGSAITMIVFISAALLIAYWVGITNPKDAYNALDNMGYKNIEMTGYNFFACSKDDWYHTGFKAINQNGKIVTGTVCSGLLFKNSTVRFN